MVSHWKASKPRWALEHDGVLLTGEFPLSCGTIVKLPRLFATRAKAREWSKNSNITGILGWKPVRLELGYRRIGGNG